MPYTLGRAAFTHVNAWANSKTVRVLGRDNYDFRGWLKLRATKATTANLRKTQINELVERQQIPQVNNATRQAANAAKQPALNRCGGQLRPPHRTALIKCYRRPARLPPLAPSPPPWWPELVFMLRSKLRP